MIYHSNSNKDLLLLGAALKRLKFDRFLVGIDLNNPADVLSMLSDLDWYDRTWSHKVNPYKEVGRHPIAGEEGAWDTYLEVYTSHTNALAYLLVEPRPKQG
jgi:hypothetical protein